MQRKITNDNEWQQMTTSGTTHDSEWERVLQRMATSDNEWQRVTMNDNEWQRLTTNDNEWFNEQQRVVQQTKAIRVILDFRMKQLCNVKLQYIQQRLFENIMQNRTFAEAATRGVL